MPEPLWRYDLFDSLLILWNPVDFLVSERYTANKHFESRDRTASSMQCDYIYKLHLNIPFSNSFEFINCYHNHHILELPISIYRDEIADLTMEDIALAIAMESLEDIDG